MASASEIGPLPVDSYQTALCIIPPLKTSIKIDSLRSLYDKAHGRWPAHINLVYPFVTVDNLPQALDLIRLKLLDSSINSEQRNIQLRLETADHFSHRHSNTVFVAPNADGTQRLAQLRGGILESLGHGKCEEEYRPHLTIGQSSANAPPLREHLLESTQGVLPLDWPVEELVVLVREGKPGAKNAPGPMKIWGTIELSTDTVSTTSESLHINEEPGTAAIFVKDSKSPEINKLRPNAYAPRQCLDLSTESGKAYETLTTQERITYHFSVRKNTWEPVEQSVSQLESEQIPELLAISSYNVLYDPSLPPPFGEKARFPLILTSILSRNALADTLVLQEVSDDFLSRLLSEDKIRNYYCYTTHAPSTQAGISPLPSLRNVVVLSRRSFTWGLLPFDQQHKGAVILEFEALGMGGAPLVVAAVHLTAGLSNSTVAAKRSQIVALMDYLDRERGDCPWIVAGDFNITTSKSSISEAVRAKAVSIQTAGWIMKSETMLNESGLADAWVIAGGPNRKETNDEKGATFDPEKNPLAAETSKRGASMRPQRYDRILLKGKDMLEVADFDMFARADGGDFTNTMGGIEGLGCGSDHWGIRATLRIKSKSRTEKPDDTKVRSPLKMLRKAPSSLSSEALQECLTEQSAFPTEEEEQKRIEVYELTRNVLLQDTAKEPRTGAHIPTDFSLVVVPVGSYGLGVWSQSSDIDIFCIGCISAKLFFNLASKKLMKAAHLGVRILRKVEAASGTMLEIQVRGVRVDVQYCPAYNVVGRWPEVAQLPPTDPIFNLSAQSLTKLNAWRDLNYLQQTIPKITTFRTAHRFIKAWAKQRGIYSSKFGYLGGFHITLLLSRICKLLFHEAADLTEEELICTFFNDCASFDWSTNMILDPDFDETQPGYTRLLKEPMLILNIHAPRINVARAASVPTVNTIVDELKRAQRMLMEPGVTWQKLIGNSGNQEPRLGLSYGAQEFLSCYNSYIRINVNYWGGSLAEGSSLVGWVESRCVTLLVDLNSKLPSIHARLWPGRFRPSGDDATGNAGSEYQGCYLIGLTKAKPENIQVAKASTDSDRKGSQGTLTAIIGNFMGQLRSDEKYFDPSSSSVDGVHVKRSDLEELKLDDRDWGSMSGS